MRKGIFIFVVIIIVAVCFCGIKPCIKVKTSKEQFGRNLTYTDMCEYKDPDYDFIIRYPSFFKEQAEMMDEYTGYARFIYRDQQATVVLEGYAMNNRWQTVQSAMYSLASSLHATRCKHGEDFFIISGPQYEDGSRVEGYSYYSKFVRNGRLLFVYTMVYPDCYRDVLTRLFKEIDDWQVWKRHLRIKN